MNSIVSSQLAVSISSAPLLVEMLVNRVCAGFPSPAEDLGAQRVDLTQLLGVQPQATYFLCASGQSTVMDTIQQPIIRRNEHVRADRWE